MTPQLREAVKAHRKAQGSAGKAQADADALKVALRSAREAGHTEPEIGRALGVSKQRIHALLK